MAWCWTRLVLLSIIAAVGARGTPEVVWRSFGNNTGCGKGIGAAGAVAAGDWTGKAASLVECEALCVKQTSELVDPSSKLACRSVEYTAATGRCRFFPGYVRYTHMASGAQCASIVGVDPVEVFVMLPLDTLSNDGKLKDRKLLTELLDKMQEAEVDGYMTDVWWGITERQPGIYSFEGYRELFDMARARDWNVQVVTSFHKCGGNVGDVCDIPLPSFVLEAEGVWYTDADGVEDREYISLFADDVKLRGERTPIDMYRDWMDAFYHEFESDLGTLITEVMVGTGPCGELRYPSYRMDRWTFCGVGQFQAFDTHALAALADAAAKDGHPASWGSPPGPESAGDYNSHPADTEFFSAGYRTEYGKFFMEWYSNSLKMHGKRVLANANAVFRGTARITGKLAGLHWWYDSESHAAEAAAGYYNTNGRNAYRELAEVFAAEGAEIDFTCLEMRYIEQPRRCHSNPEGLVRQVITAAHEAGIGFGGENALSRYDHAAHNKILTYRPVLSRFTFLRLDANLVRPENLEEFTDFVARLHGVDPTAGRRLAELPAGSRPYLLV